MNNSIMIRSMKQSDINLVYKWRNDPRVRRHMINSNPIDLNTHVSWFEKSSQDQQRQLLIVLKENIPFGFAQFNLLNCATIADWGFYVDPDGPKGQGSVLGKLVLSYGFRDLRLHRVTGQVLNGNHRSIVLHQRLGFKAEGILRSQYLTEYGYQDVHLFGMLSSEWIGGTMDVSSISTPYKSIKDYND